MGSFYFFLFQAHSGWRWIALLLLVVTTVKVIIGLAAGQKWTGLDQKLVTFTNIAVSIQVLLGIFLYVLLLTQGGGITGKTVGALTGGHLVPALLALGGIGFASARSKKASTHRQKFMMATIGMVIAIVLVLGALMTVGGPFAMATAG
ncbi:MAG: hypothetical protein KDJ52_32530 [Anaerolineae bacterium]|nr:hypothetical protein [Anaerolineae bacterium]